MGKGDRRLTVRERARLRAGQAAPAKAGKRTGSGQLSRAAGARPAKPEAPPPAVVVRMREHGLSEDDARGQLAGTGHGLLLLAGAISQEGYDVAERYRRLREAYQRVISGPREYGTADLGYRGEYQAGRQAQRADGGQGLPPPALRTPEERDAEVRRDWEAVEAALAFRGPALGALNDAVMRDRDLRRRPREVEALVAALAALATLWGHDPQMVVPRADDD